MISHKEKEVIINFLIKYVKADLIYIFGSYAKNRERKNSDLDIAFLTDVQFDQYDVI